MLYDVLALPAAVLHGVVDVETCLGVVALFEENPGVRVEVGSIARLGLDGAIAHFLGTVEVTAFERKVVGVVVEHADVIGLVDQC